MKTLPYTALATVYDAIMSDVEYDAWAEFVLFYIAHLNKNININTVLDLACGTGNFTIELKKNNLNVKGLDFSEDMLKVAKTKYPYIDFLKGNFLDFELSERFDLITSVFDSLNNLTDPNDLKKAFLQIYKHLNKNGIFVADLNTKIGVRELWEDSCMEGIVCQDGKEIYYRWMHSYDAKTELATVDAYCKLNDLEWIESHVERGYDGFEIEKMLLETGFSEIYITEYPNCKLSDNPARIWVFAFKGDK